MKQFLIAAAAVLGLAATAAAQEPAWPSKTVRITVGFAAGSTPDLMARIVADHLGKQTGQAFVVENRPGAGGNIAVDAVARAAPDGHTLGATIPGPLVVNPMTMVLPYDAKADLAPITILGTQPSVLAVGATLNVSTLAELVARIKAEPKKYNYASIGVGSISHLAMEMIALAAGAELTHVPYKSSPEAIRAVIAGDAQMAALPPLAVTGPAKAGEVRLLAVTTAKRWPTLPDVPTFQEAGLADVQAEAWMALVAPGKTPPETVARIHAAVKAALAKPDAVAQMRNLNFEPVVNSPAEFLAVLAAEDIRWGKVVDKIGLRKK